MPAPKGNQYGLNNDGGRPRIFETVEAMQEAIDKYFEECKASLKEIYDKKKQELVTVNEPTPWTVEGLALALGFCDLNTLLNYEKKEGYEEFFSAVKKAKLKIQQNKVINGLNGNYNPAVAIFDLKNNHGYRDKTETDLTSGGDKIVPQIYIPDNGRNKPD